MSDNPHAFPNDGRGSSEFAGMTLRDYFAAKALQGLLSASYGDEGHVPALTDNDFVKDNAGTWVKPFGQYRAPTSYEKPDEQRYRMVTTLWSRMSRDAYAVADAMLKARKQK